MRIGTVVVAGLLVLGSTAACSPGGCALPDGQPREVTRPDVPQTADDAANLTVDLAGALAETTRVTVTFDDDLALDVEVPGTSVECATNAVSRYGYRVEPGPVTVLVDSGDEQERVDVPAGGSPHWVVVTLQDGFPLSADLWDERPAYG